MATNTRKTIDPTTLLKDVPTGVFIGGQWRDAAEGETFDVVDPATEQTLVQVASACQSDALAALEAAHQAQASWESTAPRDRAELLRAAFENVNQHADELATLMTLEMGKPLEQAYGEVTYGAEFLRWFSEEAVRHYGRAFPVPEGHQRVITRHRAVGPCLLITPWNFPLAMATRKIAPALAAGCTVIIKPAKLTPLTTLYFTKLLQEVGLPDGVVNVLPAAHAADVSEPLLNDPRLRKLSFTGSTAVGKTLLKASADNLLRTSMELGGNAPFIVFEDADIDAAVEGAVAAKMRNGGQACISANRLYVHESIAGEFTEKLTKAIADYKIGHGLDAETTLGPLINADAVEHMEQLTADALAKGAHLTTGGKRGDGEGFFFQPTVLADVTEDMRVASEEIFGPIAPVLTFTDEDEVLAKANDTEYGLASYVFTENVDRLWRVSEALQFGIVGFNAGVVSNAAAPFGGVKHSGMGREGAAEGIEEYSSVQYIGVRDPYSGK